MALLHRFLVVCLIQEAFEHKVRCSILTLQPNVSSSDIFQLISLGSDVFAGMLGPSALVLYSADCSEL